MKTFESQYLPVESAFLLSLADVATLWSSKRWDRYSTHSDNGIFLESNMVLVIGVNFLPHQAHS